MTGTTERIVREYPQPIAWAVVNIGVVARLNSDADRCPKERLSASDRLRYRHSEEGDAVENGNADHGLDSLPLGGSRP